MTIKIRNEILTLLPEKAIYWEQKKILLLADLHLGKSGHFRKAGIPLPSQIHHHDLDRLSKIIRDYSVEKIYLLGDLFHSEHNKEWNHFIEWRRNTIRIEIHLIKGNHDILTENDFFDAGLILHDFLIDEPFIFYHKKNTDDQSGLYQVSGHIHPGVHLNGRARQSETVPCFYFGQDNAILPAFGNFTGTALFDFKKSDKLYMILHDRIVEYG